MTGRDQTGCSTINLQEIDDQTCVSNRATKTENFDDILSLITDECSPWELQQYMNDSTTETLLQIANNSLHESNGVYSLISQVNCQLLETPVSAEEQLLGLTSDVGLLPPVSEGQVDVPTAGAEMDQQVPVLTTTDHNRMIDMSTDQLLSFEDTIHKADIWAFNNEQSSSNDDNLSAWLDTTWNGDEQLAGMQDADVPLTGDNEVSMADQDRQIAITSNNQTPRRLKRDSKLTSSEALERKRELNRAAAKRCRDKKLQEQKNLEKRVAMLRTKHSFLRQMRQLLINTGLSGER